MTVIKKTLLAAACVSTLLMAGSAIADTSNLVVTGDVTGICKFVATPPMDFGQLDTSASANAVKTSAVTYKCTAGTKATSLSIAGSTNTATASVSLVNGSDATTLPLSLAWTTDTTTAGLGFGAVTPISVTVTGTIAFAALNTATAGHYAYTAAMILMP